jgi:N-acetylmuramoyl-L-alanine amidase
MPIAHSAFMSLLLKTFLGCVLVSLAGCAAPRQQPTYLAPSTTSLPQQTKPLPQPTKQQQQPQRSGPLVFLDPGHGGRDGGAAVKPTHLQEKALSLEIVKRVERLLTGWNYNVALSRRTDVFIPLQKRVAMAAHVNASIFVSIHFNSAVSRKGRGAEVLYYNSPNSPRTIDSKRLATTILCRLCDTLPTRCRGIKHGDLCVIRETAMPAVLVEPAFINNPQEAKLLASAPYKQRIASAIAKGINDYFHQK